VALLVPTGEAHDLYASVKLGHASGSIWLSGNDPYADRLRTSVPLGASNLVRALHEVRLENRTDAAASISRIGPRPSCVPGH